MHHRLHHPPPPTTTVFPREYIINFVMSRSALWRQEDNVKERERKATVIYDNAIEEGRSNNHLKGVIPLIGPDDTFNLHPMLLNNIVNSAYFQKCCERLTDWNTLVDEIYYEVKHVEPWTAGE